MWLGPALEVGVLAGLVARGRVRRLWSLPLLLVGLLLSGLLVAVWPTLRTWRFWTAKETAHALLFFVLGLEIVVRVFSRLPFAALATRASIGVLALVTIVLLLLPPHGHPALTLVPRLLASAAWLYLGVLAIRLLFIVPLDPLHKTVLVAVGPYMMFYAYTWGRVDSREAVAHVGYLNAMAFTLVLGALLWAAWRDEPAPEAAPETVRFLWPWS